jgi:hypothetical protein
MWILYDSVQVAVLLAALTIIKMDCDLVDRHGESSYVREGQKGTREGNTESSRLKLCTGKSLKTFYILPAPRLKIT